MTNPSYTNEQVLEHAAWQSIPTKAMILYLLADRQRLQAEVEALRLDGYVTPLEDSVLLRNLVEEVEEMHPTVRNQLLQLAKRIDKGEQIGVTRCRRCGEKAEVTVHSARATPNETKEAKS